MSTDNKHTEAKTLPVPSVGSGALFGVMTNREHDLIIALRQLCEATEKQCAANEGEESILVRVKRNNAKRILEKYDPLSSPNAAYEPAGETPAKNHNT